MKKILIIISIVCYFSIAQITNAAEWYIESLLQLPTWPEAFDINIEKLPNYTFETPKTQNLFNSYRKVSLVLKDEFLNQYELGNIDYYAMRDLINNYNLFIYHTNKMFYYISLKDNNPWLVDTIYPISKNYSLSRIHYNKIKNIINNSR